jgi:hypothetical protein
MREFARNAAILGEKRKKTINKKERGNYECCLESLKTLAAATPRQEGQGSR